MSRSEGFHTAPFGIDGQLEGEGFWHFAQLSEKWVDICGDALEHFGPAFDHEWAGPLSFVRTKLTSADDCAIVTIYLRDHVASSLLLLRGDNVVAEEAARTAFIKSLAETQLVRSAAHYSGVVRPFDQANVLNQRPLVIVVAVPDEAFSEEDFKLARELSLHLAGAYFLKVE